MYKSPVELYVRDIKQQMTEKLEEVCYTAVIEYFPNVDKDELIRALRYDRQQYEQGYRDAIAEKALVEVVRCKDCRFWDEYHEGSLSGPGTGMGCCLEGLNVIDGRLADDYCSRGERKDNE